MVEPEKALEDAKRALQEADCEEASPKATEAEVVDLHLLLADCAKAAGDLSQAADHYDQASRKGDTIQATRGKLECLKARLRLVGSKKTKANTERAREVLLATIAPPQEAGSVSETVVTIWRRLALEDDRDNLIGQIFTFGRHDPRLFEGFLETVQVAIDGAHTPAQSRTHSSAVVEDEFRSFAEQEALGVLLYYRGIASHAYQVPDNVANEDRISQASKSWRFCRKTLGDVGGRNALNARADATAELSKHYFQRALERFEIDSERTEVAEGVLQNASGPLDKLRELDESSFHASYSDPAALLGAAYHRMGDSERCTNMLTRWLKPSLDILDDDMPENDVEGIVMIYRIMANHGHPEDTVIALSLLGQPDLVSEALSFEIEDIHIGGDDIDKTRMLDDVTQLARDIIQVVKAQIPDASQQTRRIKAAVNSVQSLLTEAASQDCSPTVGGVPRRNVGEGDPRESVLLDTHMATARRLVHDRLTELEQRHTREVDRRAFQSRMGKIWACDGRSFDGQRCPNILDFDRQIYHCMYCWSKDFCAECFQRLRHDDKTSAIITACSPGHSWVIFPPCGKDFYRGLGAKILKIPSLKPLAHDPRVLEICFAEGQEITLEYWKESLATKCSRA